MIVYVDMDISENTGLWSRYLTQIEGISGTVFIVLYRVVM